MNNKNKLANITLILSIYGLLALSFLSSIQIGFSWDEYFHHINGLVRFKFLNSLGEFEKYQFRNNEFYPGLYDTLSYSVSHLIFLIKKDLFIKFLAEIMHILNFTFSSLSILGLYILSKKIFNKRIALFTCLLTLMNPFFFGHMGMNSKDLIIFFSLIWFCYYFYLYCASEKNVFKYLIYSSFFIGFGCGVRLTFLVVIFPVVMCGIVYLFNKYQENYLYILKRLFLHSFVAILIIIFFIILCWPHMIVEIQNGNFINFFSLIVKNTISWLDGPKIGIINGEYYEVFNTPKTYFLDVLIYRIPFYFTVLTLSTYIFFFSKKLVIKNYINNFKTKFLTLNVITFFPIILTLVLGVNIYDNLRLFLFVIPFFCLIAAFSIDQFTQFLRTGVFSKISLAFILILFLLSFYRFIILTPYQYTYVNYSYPSFKNSKGKFEHDYWGASYKELVEKIKSKYNKKEIENFKIADCAGGDFTLIYYLNKSLGIKKTYSDVNDLDQATHIVMNNRAFLDIYENVHVKDLINRKDGSMKVKDMKKVARAPNIRKSCFSYENFKGEDSVFVSRDGLPLTIFRKLEKK